MSEAISLLDAQFLRRLEHMQVVNKRLKRGTQMGKRRSKNRGSSIEFADYRSYTPGDDLRQLDWNAYARLGKLFLKTFLDEQESHISLYIDCSTSMEKPYAAKWRMALQLAAAIGFLSLHQLDRVSVFAVDDHVRASLIGCMGKGKAPELLRFIQSLATGGIGDIDNAFRSPQAIHGQPGISFVFSDFLFANGYEQGLRFLQATKQDVCVIKIWSEQERNPQLQGDIRLIDSETADSKEFAVTPPLLQAYRQGVSEFEQRLRTFAYSRGMSVVHVEAEQSVEDVIFRAFHQAGFLQ